MCGIVGYIGEKQAVDIIIEGLSKLEYRGYDSAGVAILDNDGELNVEKAKGRLAILEDRLKKHNLLGKRGIGHTRWATHGIPSDANAHPHVNENGNVAVVHNGIIENYQEIKKWLQEQGVNFASQTDTEAIAHLVNYYDKGDFVAAVQKTVDRIEGSYALAIISKKHPDMIIAVRKDSPLIVGLGEGENFIASDIPAILKHTREVAVLEDGEMAALTKENVVFYNSKHKEIKKTPIHIDWDITSAEKSGYEHFMIKEIHEQPKALFDTFMTRVKNGRIDLSEVGLTQDMLKDINRIYVIGCGTAYYAGLVGKKVFENLAKIPTVVEIASEFRYSDAILNKDDLCIIISQSGETIDTLGAMRVCKAQGCKTLAITNVLGSTISREVDAVLYTVAGPEIAVASTKAYLTQLMAVNMIALELSYAKGTIDSKQYEQLLNELQQLPEKAKRVISEKTDIQKFAALNFANNSVFFLGRQLDYPIALEGALKLKEISYIHAEAFPAGELKHGPIALIEKNTLVVVSATQHRILEKSLSNMMEVKARGANVLAICKESDKEKVSEIANWIFTIPDANDLFAPVLAVIIVQLYAYYVSVERGCDVDKPRNLAKSVTVE